MQQLFNDVKQKAVVLVTENATVLLTAGGVVGTVATAVLTGRASFKAAEIIRNEELKAVHEEGTEHSITEGTMGLSTSQRVKLVWPLFLPPIVTGGGTVVSIVMANRMSAQKAAALAAAYGLAERNLSDYKEKVTEKLTGPKKKQIEDEIAQDHVTNTPGAQQVIIVNGDSDVLCFDKPTGRYFKSSMEKINRALNSLNAEILRHSGASATYFYDELELPGTSWTDACGWGIGEQVSLDFTTARSNDERPCLVIDFNQMPHPDWGGSYQ